MAYRKGLVLSFGILTMIVSADGMKNKPESLTSVCCGPTGTGEHLPTQVFQSLNCPTCGVLASSDLKKAKKVGNDFVVMDAQEIATVRDQSLGATKKMLNVTVHPLHEVTEHTLQGDSVYALSPEGAPQIGAYSLMVDAIERHSDSLAFCTQWTPASKVSLYQLKVYKGVLVMEQRCAPEEVRPVPTVSTIEPTPDHQAMLDQVLANVTTSFDVGAYANQYAIDLAALVASKEAVAGVALERVATGPKPAATSGGVDLTAALAAMLGAAAPEPIKAPVKRVRKPKVDA